MTKFTDNLWSDLARELGPKLAQTDRPELGRAGGNRILRRPRIVAGSTLGLAGVGTALVLALSGSTAPPAFAITKQGDGSVLVKLNYHQNENLPQVNRKLAAMGIERIGPRALAAGEDLSSIPSCSSIPPGWKGEWVQMAGSSSGPGYSISESVAPGTWALLYCTAGHVPADQGGTGSGGMGSGNIGNTGAG
jgi:hypothetical protein